MVFSVCVVVPIHNHDLSLNKSFCRISALLITRGLTLYSSFWPLDKSTSIQLKACCCYSFMDESESASEPVFEKGNMQSVVLDDSPSSCNVLLRDDSSCSDFLNGLPMFLRW